jgi:16S rRNA (adenine1518-N6/adenine1519-N6)-dimethyltransferase
MAAAARGAGPPPGAPPPPRCPPPPGAAPRPPAPAPPPRAGGGAGGAAVGEPLYAGVSAKLGLLADVRIELTIPRSVFWPVPNVDSVMVRFTRRADAPSPHDRRRLFALIDAAFAQRRKTLRNTLRRVVGPAVLSRAAEVAGIDLGARAEALAPDDLRRLDAAIAEVGALE